ncbi:unnamed protein product, partial [marine sediment metagenome]
RQETLFKDSHLAPALGWSLLPGLSNPLLAKFIFGKGDAKGRDKTPGIPSQWE